MVTRLVESKKRIWRALGCKPGDVDVLQRLPLRVKFLQGLHNLGISTSLNLVAVNRFEADVDDSV